MGKQRESHEHGALSKLNIPADFDLSWLPDQTLDLLRRDEAGERYTEIASATGLNIGTVKSKLNRARAKIAARLVEAEIAKEVA